MVVALINRHGMDGGGCLWAFKWLSKEVKQRALSDYTILKLMTISVRFGWLQVGMKHTLQSIYFNENSKILGKFE